MKILVAFAVHAEFAAWQRQNRFRQVARKPFPLYAGRVGDSAVRVLLTGMGSDAASQAIRWAFESATDFCISSGMAGALRSDLAVGELLAARVVCRGGSDLAVASDRHLFAAAGEAGARPVDRFLTARHLVTDAQEKMALSMEGDAVEMESYTILAEAARHGVRAVSVRAVSDVALSSLPLNFEQMLDGLGRIRLRSLLAQLARRPQQLPSLVRLALDCRKASMRLAEFLNPYLEIVENHMDRSASEMVAAV
jgi:adenosylhomocysteine nucleosidase